MALLCNADTRSDQMTPMVMLIYIYHRYHANKLHKADKIPFTVYNSDKVPYIQYNAKVIHPRSLVEQITTAVHAYCSQNAM